MLIYLFLKIFQFKGINFEKDFNYMDKNNMSKD